MRHINSSNGSFILRRNTTKITQAKTKANRAVKRAALTLAKFSRAPLVVGDGDEPLDEEEEEPELLAPELLDGRAVAEVETMSTPTEAGTVALKAS